MVSPADDEASGELDPLENELLGYLNQGSADGRIVVADWAGGIDENMAAVPSVRVRSRWVNMLWLLPIGVVLLLIGVAGAQQLRTYPWMIDFLRTYPGTSSDYVATVTTGFPWWLRWQHFFNLIFMMFIIRAGLQILADHPRLYLNSGSRPGSEWLRLRGPVPPDRMDPTKPEQIWTAKDDSVALPKWLGRTTTAGLLLDGLCCRTAGNHHRTFAGTSNRRKVRPGPRGAQSTSGSHDPFLDTRLDDLFHCRTHHHGVHNRFARQSEPHHAWYQHPILVGDGSVHRVDGSPGRVVGLGFTVHNSPSSQPFFWPNGEAPNSPEYSQLQAGGFADFRLRIDGLVEHPIELSLPELKAMPKREQITAHYCIQGWSGVAKWGGVAMSDLLNLVKPHPAAKWVVFYSFSDGPVGGRYYDCHRIDNMSHELTILAYEMNDKPLLETHGAPLRLRDEAELGFKQVKWVAAVEFVESFAHLGAGQGGYNEDQEFYGYRMPI